MGSDNENIHVYHQHLTTGANKTGSCFSSEGSWANGDFPMDMMGWLEGAGLLAQSKLAGSTHK